MSQKRSRRVVFILICCGCWLLICGWLVLPETSQRAFASGLQALDTPTPDTSDFQQDIPDPDSGFQDEATPAPAQSPTVTLSPSPTPQPSPSPSPTPSPTPTLPPSPTPTPIPSPSPAPSPTASPSLSPTPSPSPTITTTPGGGSRGSEAGVVVSIVLGLLGSMLTVLGIVLYIFYARQQHNALRS